MNWTETDFVYKASGKLYDEVLPNLFMGGTSSEENIDSPQVKKEFSETFEFDCVVTLYAWATPVNWGVEERRFGFPDRDIIENYLPTIHELADWAHQKWVSGKRVLIRCQAGHNRSGFITALVLMNQGYSTDEAIDLVRKARSDYALNNYYYVDYLRNFESEKVTIE